MALMMLEALLCMTQAAEIISFDRVPTLVVHGEGPPHGKVGASRHGLFEAKELPD